MKATAEVPSIDLTSTSYRKPNELELGPVRVQSLRDFQAVQGTGGWSAIRCLRRIDQRRDRAELNLRREATEQERKLQGPLYTATGSTGIWVTGEIEAKHTQP